MILIVADPETSGRVKNKPPHSGGHVFHNYFYRTGGGGGGMTPCPPPLHVSATVLGNLSKSKLSRSKSSQNIPVYSLCPYKTAII